MRESAPQARRERNSPRVRSASTTGQQMANPPFFPQITQDPASARSFSFLNFIQSSQIGHGSIWTIYTPARICRMVYMRDTNALNAIIHTAISCPIFKRRIAQTRYGTHPQCYLHSLPIIPIIPIINTARPRPRGPITGRKIRLNARRYSPVYVCRIRTIIIQIQFHRRCYGF